MINKNPKVFISYAWTNIEHESRVVALAERLISDGVNVVLDKWDLKEGYDKFTFMEQSVTDSTIDRILLICNREYTERANNRKGGVGDETTIISPEVYKRENEGKFLPIIFEKDESGNVFCPVYIKSKIYIDLSTDDSAYEDEYEKLLRNIYEKPSYRKPILGKRPEWLDDESSNYSVLTNIIHSMKQSNNIRKFNSLQKRFLEEYQNCIDGFILSEKPDGEKIVIKFIAMKPLRDLYIDFLILIISENDDITDFIAPFFEKLYNESTSVKETSWFAHQHEHILLFIKELFICTVAILLHFEKFSTINSLICYSYYLRRGDRLDSGFIYRNYTAFNMYPELIEEEYKPKSENPRLYTYAGELQCEREYKPYINRETISEADIILCELGYILEVNDLIYSYWFPHTYIYNHTIDNRWGRLKSKRFCNKILPLFGVNNIEELKKIIIMHPVDKELKYSGGFPRRVPSITDVIPVEEIGTIN